MAASGAILARCLRMLASKAWPGVTTDELDEAAERFIPSQGAEPSFMGYRGFPGSICASPNAMVVHGIPGPHALQRGDVLSLDVGVTKDGWVADAALTVPVGRVVARPRSSSTSPRPRSSPASAEARPATTSATSRPRSSAPSRPRASRSSARWSATASAATCTRTRRSPTSASPATGRSWRRAWCSRSSRWSTPAARGPGRRGRLGGLLRRRLPCRPLRVHGRRHRGRPPHPHPLARGLSLLHLAAQRCASGARGAETEGECPRCDCSRVALVPRCLLVLSAPRRRRSPRRALRPPRRRRLSQRAAAGRERHRQRPRSSPPSSGTGAAAALGRPAAALREPALRQRRR